MNAASIRKLVASTAVCALAVWAPGQAEDFPSWAYPVVDMQPPPDDANRRTLPGSGASFTLTQLYDVFDASDWFPEDHPPMPQVVRHGRQPEVGACGVCHLPNGQGRPESASLASLPAAYIVQQLADFKSGRRRSSVPSAGLQLRMRASAVHATDDEIQAAAAYFSALTYRPWIRVTETGMVPSIGVNLGATPIVGSGASMEPIGRRIVEIPEDRERAELRDPRSGFVAYVPTGSIKRGETLVTTGDSGKTLPCSSCHAPDLKGFDTVPPIAGRSASYIVRQLHDIQTGARVGADIEPMKQVVAKLTQDDMIAIAAFVASRPP
jgi:cytochrome c553